MKKRASRAVKILALAAALVVASCAALPPKPGCAAGEGSLLAAKCRAELEVGAATLDECDARVATWEASCLR